MLGNWNFEDEAANSTLQQVNRQKSARNLEVLQFDPSEPCAVFLDAKHATKHTATLAHCDCADFNMAGASPRKVFKPCMHIYRLAMELGLIEAKYLDHAARSGVLCAYASARAREELNGFSTSLWIPSQWGGWPSELHASGIQKNRQYRAYAIKHVEPDSVHVAQDGWIIHDYTVSFSRCDCLDFRDRKLPCKHIYAAALSASIQLPFTFAEMSMHKRTASQLYLTSAPPSSSTPMLPELPRNVPKPITAGTEHKSKLERKCCIN